MNRRSFVQHMAAGAAGTAVFPAISGFNDPGSIKKAVKFNMIDEPLSIAEKFRMLQLLGFDGVELNSPSELDEKEVVEAQKETGLPIHGLVDSVHWKQTLSDPDPAVRDQGRAGLEHALKQAKVFGASTVLLVPAVVNKEVSYADAYTRSQAEIKKVLPWQKSWVFVSPLKTSGISFCSARWNSPGISMSLKVRGSVLTSM